MTEDKREQKKSPPEVKKYYSKPRITHTEPLVAAAAVCTDGGKDPGSCDITYS
ncbi:hypothetical protein ACFL27_02880 [candidate division CSSED10-310 bacterium]|uniref:Uncharacterized protein n=1 Tax=candidate division CSSED10-310 bacterium TaxID=2855610 RepID=A0ABV6YSG1_UNCC1